MSNETETIRYKRADIEGNSLGDEIVFFDSRVGKYFATGPVGADIWNLLETPASYEEIISHLLGLYAVEEATCRAQSADFIKQMTDIGLILKLSQK